MVAYHGCDRSVADAVFTRGTQLLPSVNQYDWLGAGVYFWVDSAERGMDWAQTLALRGRSRIKEPGVVGALIYPGLCLNLTDYGVFSELQEAYLALVRTTAEAGVAMPRNTAPHEGVLLRRDLDCAVINMAHQARRAVGLAEYDSVYGVFEEGEEVYPGSGFRKKTHVQIAVRNLNCIVGYFVPQHSWGEKAA
jgi:hypothetical protein